MPSYVKFMKDILTKKRRLEEYETVALTKECSSYVSNNLPKKLEDRGSFTIPCTIGDRYISRALCDLGSSINLMPTSIFKTLGVKASATTVTLQLADRTLAFLDGKIENILVKVDRLIFPADFIILDCEVDENVPIIVGRPFLTTGGAIIDVKNGELTMRVNEEKITFNVLKVMNFIDEDVDDCSAISVIDHIVADYSPVNNEFNNSELGSIEQIAENLKESELVLALETKPTRFFGDKQFESLGLHERSSKPLKPSIDEPPKLELKELPNHLRYAFLGEEKTLPVIVSSELNLTEEEQLLKILRTHKKAIGWTMLILEELAPHFVYIR
ncbi:uncharacterized protein LOC133311333 [Gastrolobium bilobum]|uniref:uncharacterized protein LOC133311333 n=1 Tax=Gastrolobium bilobum TaxID=150636 RepID=UPI002AB25474|nr:uncharacterized protein LOC133311333 [Gastrolobium bilobum]